MRVPQSPHGRPETTAKVRGRRAWDAGGTLCAAVAGGLRAKHVGVLMFVDVNSEHPSAKDLQIVGDLLISHNVLKCFKYLGDF